VFVFNNLTRERRLAVAHSLPTARSNFFIAAFVSERSTMM